MHKHLVELFQTAVRDHRDRTAMTYKRAGAWQTISYEQFGRFVEDFAGGLCAIGIERGDRVAIWSANSPEWVIADFGILTAAAVTVPIYDTLTEEQSAYILNDSQSRVALVPSSDKIEAVLAHMSELKGLERIIVMGPVPEGYASKDNIMGMDELYAQGREYLDDHQDQLAERASRIDGDDLASLVYTSGTTGNPKGVILSHKNFCANVDSVKRAFPIKHETFLGFLPLCHSFARMSDHYFAYDSGSTVAFAESIEKLTDNMQEVRPSIMSSVPRLYEKMYAKVLDGVDKSSPTKQRIFHWAVDVGKEYAHTLIDQKQPSAALVLKHKLATALVFSKIHKTTGGNLKAFVSGGAALSPEIQEFFCAAGLWILQGYGLTETSPVLTLNRVDGELRRPTRMRIGSSGPAVPDVELKIADDGEILAKGPNVFSGYYGLDKETKEVFTDDGWFMTGDIGHIDDDGYLFITDRKKELFKTTYGKYIAPQAIEGKLKDQPYIAMAVAIGENRKYVGALICPDFERLVPWAKEQGIDANSHEELIEHADVRSLIEADVNRVNGTLSRFEQIKRFELLPRELTQDDGELTPTLKVKRRVINEAYAEQIEALYPSS